MLADGIEFPPLTTRFRDRHAVVVARGPGYKSDLRIVRPYIRNFKPVLVAVDGGADALLEIGLKPHVIVGDFDSVSDAALRSGAELLVHAYADGRAPGSERLTRARAPVRDRLGAGDQRGHRPAARARSWGRADRGRGHPLQSRRVPGAQPRGHGLDVRDAAQGRRVARRREGRLAARLAADRDLAARDLRRWPD